MALLDVFKRLFTRDDIPDETRRLFESARSTQELLRGLDHLLTTNEVQFKELDDEINKLERLEQIEVGRIKTGELTGRQKRNALLYIKRLRKQMDAYEQRLRIYDRNMNLHLNLISKIQDIEAMKLRGVDETRIDAILMEFEENLEKYNETMNAASVLSETQVTRPSADEERELRALETELLGGGEKRAAEPEIELDEPDLEPIEEAVAEAPLVDLEVSRRAAAEAERARAERARLEHPASGIERLVEREMAGDRDDGAAARARREAELDRIEQELLEE